VRWDYFYGPVGKAVVALVRKFLTPRRDRPQFRRGDYHFHNDWGRYQSKGLLPFSRRHGTEFSLAALNFGDQEQTVPFAFPDGGDYREELHGNDDLAGVAGGAERWLTVPGNYGRISDVEDVAQATSPALQQR